MERLAFDLSDRALAVHLLDLRRTLERARSEEEAAAARDELALLVPPDLSET